MRPIGAAAGWGSEAHILSRAPLSGEPAQGAPLCGQHGQVLPSVHLVEPEMSLLAKRHLGTGTPKEPRVPDLPSVPLPLSLLRPHFFICKRK